MHQPVSDQRPRTPARERGVLLIWTGMVLLLIGAVVLVGTESGAALDRMSKADMQGGGQARAVAEAGIVDAYAWFRRQQDQPVSTFAPRRDLGANPPVNETDDPQVGLVREYEIAPSLWGRYEVRLTKPAEPYEDLNSNGHYDAGEPYTDQDDNGHWDPVREVADVSAARGVPGNGGVWRLVSHGFLYERPKSELALGEGLNQRVAMARVATEIRRLTVTPPAGAVVCTQRGDSIVIGNRGRVVGGDGAAIAFASDTGSPEFHTGSEVSGSPRSSAQSEYLGDLEDVFGVSAAQLRSMADVSTVDLSAIGSPIGEYSLNVIEGDAVFNEHFALRGTGVVVVLGDLTIKPSSNSFFSGLIWVEGDVHIRAPAYLRGVVIARGKVDIRGTGGDYAELNYDPDIIGELLLLMGQYRYSKAIFDVGTEPDMEGK